MKIKITLLLAVLSIVVSSCDDFLERDLNGQTVTVLAPANNTISTSFTVTFWWDDLKGASKYKIQIVKPSFNSIQQLVVDTLISNNQFLYTLQPGSYQWRIRGENDASISDFVIYNLTIDSSLNLSSQTLLLNSPVNNNYSNSFTQTFSWFAMPNASDYLFGIFNSSGIQIGNYQSIVSPITTTTYTFTAEGTYKWRVFAQNNQSSSPYSERTITIDTTRPSIPVLTYSPINDTTSLHPIPLSWNSVEPNCQYKLLISTDSTFASYFDTITSNLNYNYYNSIVGQFYYWKIQAIDQSNNSGLFSLRKRFKRQ